MVIVGLTGGIASGKTTVAHLFSQWGVDVIDADLVGREILEKNKIVSSEIKKKFGKEICKTSGKLDTKKLRKIIFENKNKENKIIVWDRRDPFAFRDGPFSFYRSCFIGRCFSCHTNKAFTRA